jgi:hypothetical protein
VDFEGFIEETTVLPGY